MSSSAVPQSQVMVVGWETRAKYGDGSSWCCIYESKAEK